MQRSRFISFVFAVTVVISSGSADAISVSSRHIDNNLKNIEDRKQSCRSNNIPQENDQVYWSEIGNNLLRQKLNLKHKYGVAKNVIFFIGDGMSITTLTSARIYMGQLMNKTGENEMLSFEKFPFTGLSKTYCVDSQVADSACSATAFLSGVKGNIETIGVSGMVNNRDCLASNKAANQAVSSMRWAQQAGKRTGVVTNMRVTHATPAGAYANVANRNWECDGDVYNDVLANKICVESSLDIARQLVEKDTGKNLNVVMGGGRLKFLPDTTTDEKNVKGQRMDKRDLIKAWQSIPREAGERSVYVSDRSKLTSLNTNQTDYLLGLFASSHMQFNLLADKTVEPTLEEMTEAAIKVLSKGDEGFYLFVEGGLIDWAHHGNLAHLALDETVMLSKAVQKALDMTSREDTLIVVTSDHSHTMTLNGYPHRGSNILGHPQTSDRDKMPYSSLSYANGPSNNNYNADKNTRRNLTNDDVKDAIYQFPAMVNLTYETHGGDDVAVFAIGPWAHLFIGNYEQNFIPYAISYATQMGPGVKHDNQTSTSSGSKNAVRFGILASFVSCTLVLHLLR